MPACGEVFGTLRQGAVTQPDGDGQQDAAIDATAIDGTGRARCRFTGRDIRHKIAHWLTATFVPGLVRYPLEGRDGRWRLPLDFDNAAFPRLLARRLGRTTLLTSRLDWTAGQVVVGCRGQQQIEASSLTSRGWLILSGTP